MMERIYLPIRIVSTANTREHWGRRLRREKEQRAMLRMSWMSADSRDLRKLAKRRPLVVTLERVGPRQLDSDNATISLKHIRDECAKLIGVDDLDGTDGVTWDYAQRKGDYGVIVTIEVPS